MPSLFEQARDFRRALLARDSAAAAHLTAAYGEVYRDIQRRVEGLTADIEAARARGEEVNAYWLAQRDRLGSLVRQVEAETARFSILAQGVITSAQADLAGLAQGHARDLVSLSAGAQNPFLFARLNTAAVENVVGFLSPGAPLNRLLDRLAGSAAERVRQKLVTAVALGRPARRVASEVREALGGNLTQALGLARTSIVGAYRASTLETYRANADVVKAWRWLAAKSLRTCLNCLARDGTVWPLSKPMPAHWNCRCTFVPVVAGQTWRRQTGEEWFAAQPADAQRSMMGARAHEHYARGEVSLSDFAGQRKDKALGTVTYQRSLKEVLERKRKAA